MPGLTVAEARARVSDLLDDPNNVRWSVTKVSQALQSALSACVIDYVAAGGTAFDESISGTTSTSGTFTPTPVLSHIKSVQVVTGSWRAVVRPVQPQDIELVDAVQRNVLLVAVREWVVSSTPSHQLVSDNATTGPSWTAFDLWVCAQAALDLGITDNDKRPGLEAAWARYRDAAVGRVSTPRSRTAPLPRADRSFVGEIGWSWDAVAQTLTLGRVRGELW